MWWYYCIYNFIHGDLLLLLVCSSCCCRCSIVDVSISILDGSYHVVQKNVIAFAYSVVDDDDENAVMMQYCKLYSNTQTIIIGKQYCWACGCILVIFCGLQISTRCL